jgi:23S rRNA pseudouridine1911/1915/1917 synthase
VRQLFFTCKTSGLRLDRVVLDKLIELKGPKHGYSRNMVQNLVRSGNVKRNGLPLTDNSEKPRKGDEISMELYNNLELLPTAENIELNVLYEDPDLLVLNKQPGLVVHPGAGILSGTLVNAILHHCGESLSNLGGVTRPGIVHRLDKDTSGLMVVAKNNFSHDSLKGQLETRELKREYSAFIWGFIVPKNGKIDGQIGRCKHNRLKMAMVEDGRYSLTNYRTLGEFGNIASLVECSLNTGRTHQIRVHFSSRKHPLIGDRLYGGSSRKIAGETSLAKSFVEKFPRQALHSRYLEFRHPRTAKAMSFETDLPEDLQMLVKNLENMS